MLFMMTSLRHNLGCRFACVVGACALLGLGTAASAQVERLPASLASSTQLTIAQEQQIQGFVKAQFARLKSNDVTQVEDARKSLESPFADRESPSIAFRLAYGSQVAIELGPVLRADRGDTGTAVNALLVAGECGTPQTVELLGDVLAGKRGPASPAMRAAAVAALHNVIREADAGRVRKDQGEQAVTFIARALAKADNAAFASACVIALGSTERELLHAKAAQQLGIALPELASSLRNAPKIEQPERWEQSLQLGIQLIFRYILQAAGAGQMDPSLSKASIESGAQALGFVVTRLRDLGPAGLESTDELSRLLGLTNEAEKLMQLAGRTTPGFPAGLGAKLTEAVEKDDEAIFLDAAKAVARWAQKVTGKSADEYGL